MNASDIKSKSEEELIELFIDGDDVSIGNVTIYIHYYESTGMFWILNQLGTIGKMFYVEDFKKYMEKL